MGTYSTIFLASPLYATLRMREDGVQDQDARKIERRERDRDDRATPAVVDAP